MTSNLDNAIRDAKNVLDFMLMEDISRNVLRNFIMLRNSFDEE